MKHKLIWAAGAWGVVCLALVFVSCARPRPTPTSAPMTSPAMPPAPKPTAPIPLQEVRAVWVSNTDKLDWDRATAHLQRAGFNTMYVNFASGGAAFYPSALVPQVTGMTGDPLAAGVALARQRGLQVHAKLIATFMFKTTPAFQRGLLAANRVMVGPTGKPIEQAGFYWLCPTQPVNRKLLVDLTREMLTRYPVAGYHLDYIRFSEQPCCFCATCRTDFETATGAAIRQWPADVTTGPLVPRFKAWQQRVVNDAVRELTSAVRDIDPQLVRSAAVFPELSRAREEKGQDWKLWVERGDIHYICPMNYNVSGAEFRNLLTSQSALAGSPRRVVAGLGSWKLTQMSELHDLILASRAANCYGFALFSYDDCDARDFLPQFQPQP